MQCPAMQLLLLLLALAGKKYLFVYFNDSRVYRERKKNLVKFPINSSCAALLLLLLLCWLEKKFYLCFLIIKMGLHVNGLLKFWCLPNFEILSHYLNGFKDGPGLPQVRGERKVEKAKKIEKETLKETRVTCV